MRTGPAVKIEAVAIIAEQRYITTLFTTESYLEAGARVKDREVGWSSVGFGKLSVGQLGLWADSSASRCGRSAQVVRRCRKNMVLGSWDPRSLYRSHTSKGLWCQDTAVIFSWRFGAERRRERVGFTTGLQE